MLADSHCHLDLLDLTPYDGDVAKVISLAKDNDVHYLLSVAVDLARHPQLLKHADDFANVYISVGLHPNEHAGYVPSVEELLALAQHDKVVAIGETGLDYFRTDGDVSWQQQRFRTHISAAKQSKKPLIIHSRAAKEDTVKILAEEHANAIGGVMHCFTEDWAMAEQCLAMNFYISFSGIVTFKNAKDLQDVAKNMPLERMLIETDSPYLAPVPHRGKPNTPAYVKHVAEFIAQLRDEPVATIADATTNNFKKLFSIK